MSLYSLVRPAIFMLPPEKAHRAAVMALKAGAVAPYSSAHTSLTTNVAGLSFTNPVGLAPGFDKNAECFEGALAAGFGFVEIGTVTPRAQPGNPAPRVFRLTQQQALINRLGFNNDGMDEAAKNLARRSGRGIVGGNIGKNKESVDAIADYRAAMATLYPHVDYITANISSPNTPGLRDLQAADELLALITALQEVRREQRKTGAPYRPIFVKISPDCDEGTLEAIAATALSTALDGLIISNTTLARDAVAASPYATEAGGLSGKPLFVSSTETLRTMYRLTGDALPLIGVGGVASADDAYAKIRAGASLVQLYTGLVYQGFGLIREINEGLARMLARDGFTHLRDAVGSGTTISSQEPSVFSK